MTNVIHLSKPPQYNFRSTVYAHGWVALAPFGWDDATQTLTYAYWNQEHVLCKLRISDMGEHIQAVVDAASGVDFAAVEADLRWMLRLDEDFSAFYALCEKESMLQHVPLEGGGRLLRCASVWEDVVKVITTTNTAWSGTKRMCNNLVEYWGQAGFPTAEMLAGVRIEEVIEKGGLGYRAAYIHELATAVASGGVDLEGLKSNAMDTKELYKFLRSLKGIGDYAASSLLMLLGHYANVPVDSIAHTLVSRAFYDGAPVTPAQIRAQFADYGDYAGLAYWCWKFEDE